MGFPGLISHELATYRMTFSTASIIATTEIGDKYGGLFGACAGLMVGVLGATGEFSYNVMKSGLNNMIQDYYDRSTIPGGVESGWSGLSPIEFQ